MSDTNPFPWLDQPEQPYRVPAAPVKSEAEMSWFDAINRKAEKAAPQPKPVAVDADLSGVVLPWIDAISGKTPPVPPYK